MTLKWKAKNINYGFCENKHCDDMASVTVGVRQLCRKCADKLRKVVKK